MSVHIVKLVNNENGKKWPITCLISQKESSKDNFLDLKVFAEAPAEIAIILKNEGGGTTWNKYFKWVQTKAQEILETALSKELGKQWRIPSRPSRILGLVVPKAEFVGQTIKNGEKVLILDGRVDFIPTWHIASLAMIVFEKASKDD